MVDTFNEMLEEWYVYERIWREVLVQRRMKLGCVSNSVFTCAARQLLDNQERVCEETVCRAIMRSHISLYIQVLSRGVADEFHNVKEANEADEADTNPKVGCSGLRKEFPIGKSVQGRLSI